MLLLLAAVIAIAAAVLRAQLRAQILGRDAELLAALARFVAATDPTVQALGAAADPVDRSLAILVSIAKFDGVLAARLFDARGAFVASLPEDVTERTLAEAELAALRSRRPLVEFTADAELTGVFVGGGGRDVPRRAPLRTVSVPLPAADGSLEGVAQLVLQGHDVAAEFAVLDRGLALQAGGVFFVSGAVAAGVLAWAFARLARRTIALQQANAELARNARAAAVGAVAAHLMHSLKNPLAGLRGLTDCASASDLDRGGAAAATRQMETLVRRVTGILREEADGLAYEVPLSEVLDDLRRQFDAAALGGGVALVFVVQADPRLDNRTANLLGLALANLVQNALDAVGPGRRVTVSALPVADATHVEVADDGPGLPESVRGRLFTPVRSTKEGGSGLGLALSWQLLHHAGATIELVPESAGGSRFRVRLPSAVPRIGPEPHAAPASPAVHA
ncbi:MAG: sensor histidine kinase [Limisphaerales bacterium]